MIKQVIIIRKDLKMRRGKECAQASHSAMLWLVDRLSNFNYKKAKFSDEEIEWLTGKFTKICLQVNSEEELLDLLNKAKEIKLTAYLVTDSGATEFDGVPTKTCIAIGPNKAEDIDKITGHLKLY
jgi:PTH2 family peptidyl-tRNA hydrolase